ncbi:MAG: VOC family protein [Nannocystaceae bacterium]
MIDHLNLPVRDLARSARFYAAALAPLGAGVVAESPESVGLGRPDAPQIWLAPAAEVPALHLAFVAADRAAVRRFHAAALAAGATDHGAPGLRADYSPTYYAAFVRDPDGHNIEAVCHRAE